MTDKEKIIKQLNYWMEQSEKLSEEMSKQSMTEHASSFQFAAQAYWNVKQFVEVNFK